MNGSRESQRRTFVRPDWLTAWRTLMLCISVLVFVTGIIWIVPRVLTASSVEAVLAGVGLYLIAHAVRGIRLAMLVSPLLGVSGRTAALLQLATAPPALLFPFKLGELIRLHQLVVVSGRFWNSVLVILLDRMFDAMFLVPVVFVVLATHGQTTVDPSLLWLTIGASLVPLLAVVLGPGLFGALQDYVVLNHWNPKSLRLLPTLDGLRHTIVAGRAAVQGRWMQFALISVVIWACELAMVWIFVAVAGVTTIYDVGAMLAQKLAAPLAVVSDLQLASDVDVASAVGLLALLAIWPLVLTLYFRRVDGEPLRPRRSINSRRGSEQ